MTKNLAVSVLARLLNIAKAEGLDFNQVQVRYAYQVGRGFRRGATHPARRSRKQGNSYASGNF